MATHSSILAWRISWTEQPGGLQSMGLQSRTRWSMYDVQTAHSLPSYVSLRYIFDTVCVFDHKRERHNRRI